MERNKLLCESRTGSCLTPNTTITANELREDYHKIICSAVFRSLQDKTHTFSIAPEDSVRTELSHAVEVSAFAKALGQLAFDYLSSSKECYEADIAVLECAGLLHNIASPPFGRYGESAIRSRLKESIAALEYNGEKIIDFPDKAMISNLLDFNGSRFSSCLNSMKLTCNLQNALKEYPILCLLKAADDIACKTADIEDAVRTGLLSCEEIINELRSEKFISKCTLLELPQYEKCILLLQEKYRDAVSGNSANPQLDAVRNWIERVRNFLLKSAAHSFARNYDSIVAGEFNNSIISKSNGNIILLALSEVAEKYILSSEEITALKAEADKVITLLLNKLLPEAVKNAANEETMPYLKLQHVIDYICGLTDSSARKLYSELSEEE